MDYIDRILSEYSDDPYLKTVRGYCCINEAMALSRLGHHDQAERSLDIADQIFHKIYIVRPEDVMVWHGRGNVEMLGENWQSALRYIDRALELQPNYPAAKRDHDIVLGKLKGIG